MYLPARLSTSTLGDLLGSLHRSGTTGVLELREIRGPGGLGVPGRAHRVHLRAGLVIAVESALPAARAGDDSRVELRERLDALFAIEDASIGFHTARPFARPGSLLTLAPAEFLHGRPRARDRGRPRRPAPPSDDPRDRARRLLGIERTAGLGDVRRAFRKLAAMLHPDRLGAAPLDEQQQRAARFAELSAAYHLLLA